MIQQKPKDDLDDLIERDKKNRNNSLYYCAISAVGLGTILYGLHNKDISTIVAGFMTFGVAAYLNLDDRIKENEYMHNRDIKRLEKRIMELSLNKPEERQ